MTTEEKLDHILSLLTGFIEKQETFNTQQLGTNARFEVSLDSIRRDLAELQYEEELQHNILIDLSLRHSSI